MLYSYGKVKSFSQKRAKKRGKKMKEIMDKMKIKKTLTERQKVSYASDHIDLPENGVDCFEGCNPYGFPAVVHEVYKNFDVSRMGPYPHSPAFFNAIHEFWEECVDVEKDNVVLADGSINAIYIINNIFDTHNAKVYGISPQFADYYENAQFQGLTYDPYVLKRENNYKLNIDEFIENIDDRYNYVYIDNPNNPTGQAVPVADIEKIVQKAAEYGIIVIVDEAYGDFMDKSNSAVNIFNKYLNLIVIRTMSKGFGLAGLRVGYIISNKEFVGYMNSMTNPYNVGELARELAAAALRNGGDIEEHKKAVARQKEKIAQVTGKNIKIAETLPTSSLILAYTDVPGVDMKAELYKRGALVVSGADFMSLDASAARIRLPKEEDSQKLIDALADLEKTLG